MPNKRAINDVSRKASRIVAQEFKNFLSLHGSQRYIIVMKNLARSSLTWAELKRTVETKEDMTVGQGAITKLLSNLEDASFVAKSDDGTYYIPDPMMIEAASNGLI
ncbi:MAG: hypothetical protein ACRDF4_05215 [Rhabdochlamydiaceae bacterium]